MQISKEEVKQIANLACLNLTPRETAKYSKELTLILDYIDQLKVVDTEGVEPRIRRTGANGLLREDEVAESLSEGQALANAPKQNMGYFLVPRVLDK